MTEYRKESDLLGEASIPKDAYWGIHTYRAIDNFPVSSYKIDKDFIKGFGLVKLACALVNKDLEYIESPMVDYIIDAAQEMADNKLDKHIIVDAFQGGAGTSTNMNVNEVIANRALEIAGKEKGYYKYIDPIEGVNLHQSTNDTYPTALKVAIVYKLRELEKGLVSLQESFQRKEKEFSDVVKVGRTQLMDAVLITLGREFAAYAEAIGRDRWRVYKCEERIRVINLGGTAVGTGLTAPRKFIFAVSEKLRELTGFGLARAEDLLENTQNLDAFVEISGILKTNATNLIKVSNDLRLMNSGPNAGFGEIMLPEVQAGSSIMPGKVNPVICEMVAQVGYRVLANDVAINNCVANGQLELNQFMPLIAHSLLESLELLKNSNNIFAFKAIDGLVPCKENINNQVNNSLATLTALLPVVGYKEATEIAKKAKDSGKSILDIVIEDNIISKEDYDMLTSPEMVCALGHSRRIKD
ncbi:MAG: aspartate ammonia-lyase [Cyanobacteriota bacterium]